MRIAIICDLHMPGNKSSIQWDFFMKVIGKLKEDEIRTVLCLGDITSFGEYDTFKGYLKVMGDFEHYYILGNSDVRDKNTQNLFAEHSSGFELKSEGVTLKGIDTAYGIIKKKDMEAVESLNDGDILFLHHSIAGLDEESQRYIEKLTKEKNITIIHAHSHKRMDYSVGQSRAFCLRAVDPDKAIGGYPCITYFDTQTKELTEVELENLDDTEYEVSKYFGISCVDNKADVKYALDNGVYGVELRCNGKDWEPDLTLVPLIEEWREKTNGYLSVHMPNLWWNDGEIAGKEKWYDAVLYAKIINADGITMHPPKVNKNKIDEAYNEFLALYKYAVESMPDKVNFGIENLHMGKGETATERNFGYTPKEITAWIEAINKAIGKNNRVCHTLDIGHARNNGIFAQMFPISRWYEMMGKKTVAYHIHQVISAEGKMKNHTAIENWFGPMISYASFFYAWKKEIINHVSIFLEVRGWQNFENSVRALERHLGDRD